MSEPSKTHLARSMALYNAHTDDEREAAAENIVQAMIAEQMASLSIKKEAPQSPKDVAALFRKEYQRGPLQMPAKGKRMTNIPVSIYLQNCWMGISDIMSHLDEHRLVDLCALVFAELLPEEVRPEVSKLKANTWVALKTKICVIFEHRGIDTGSDVVISSYFCNWAPPDATLAMSCAVLVTEVMASPLGIPGLALLVAVDNLTAEYDIPSGKNPVEAAEKFIKKNIPRNRQTVETNNAFLLLLHDYISSLGEHMDLKKTKQNPSDAAPKAASEPDSAPKAASEPEAVPKAASEPFPAPEVITSPGSSNIALLPVTVGHTNMKALLSTGMVASAMTTQTVHNLGLDSLMSPKSGSLVLTSEHITVPIVGQLHAHISIGKVDFPRWKFVVVERAGRDMYLGHDAASEHGLSIKPFARAVNIYRRDGAIVDTVDFVA